MEIGGGGPRVPRERHAAGSEGQPKRAVAFRDRRLESVAQPARADDNPAGGPGGSRHCFAPKPRDVRMFSTFSNAVTYAGSSTNVNLSLYACECAIFQPGVVTT